MIVQGYFRLCGGETFLQCNKYVICTLLYFSLFRQSIRIESAILNLLLFFHFYDWHFITSFNLIWYIYVSNFKDYETFTKKSIPPRLLLLKTMCVIVHYSVRKWGVIINYTMLLLPLCSCRYITGNLFVRSFMLPLSSAGRT